MQKSTREVLRAPLLLSLLALSSLAAEDKPKAGEWPEGWQFRVPVNVTEVAAACDVTIEHGGLAQFDARDIRVAGPTGEAVSQLVSAIDPTHVRIIFDGAAGAGKYFIYFGNTSPKLPPPSPGVAAVGRPDWLPKGGFTCVSYSPLGPVNGKELVSLEKLLSYYERVVPQALAAEKNPPADPKAPKPVISTVYANAAQDINSPDQYFHIFKAEVEITTPGQYDFVIANAQSGDRFGVVFVDGDHKNAVVPGWFLLAYGGTPNCVDFNGHTELKAGKHVIEMYTNRRNPAIRMGLGGGTSKVPDYIGGQFANYEAQKVTPGEIEANGGNFVAATHKIISDWLAQNRFSNARTVCRYLKQRFSSDSLILKEFDTEYERVSNESYERNWLTEGKYPARSAALPDVTFTPPLNAVPQPIANPPPHDDRTHASSCLWVEGNLVYGLPYNVQDAPWGVTSAIAVEDNVLFAGTKNGTMHAVNLTRGSENWSFTSEGECVGAPLVYRGVLYYGTLDRRLYAIDIARGRMLWNFPAKGWIEGGPCASDGRIYFGSLDKNLYAIDAALGIERWEASLDGPISAPPVTDGKNVYVGTRTGTYFAVEAATGKIVWKYAAGASIRGGSCFDSKRIVFGDFSGKIHALNIATGEALWKNPAIAGGPVTAAPILLGSAVYGGTADGHVFGIDADTGEVGWQEAYPSGGDISRAPIFADGKLIFCSKTRGLMFSALGQAAIVAYQPGLHLQHVRHPVEELTPDGMTNEPSWAGALAFPLLKPNGFKANPQSDAKLLWDPKHLYIGLNLHDAQGAPAGDDDSVTVAIDPRGDGAVAYQFTINRAGVASTALLTAPGADPADPKIKPKLDQLKLAVTGADWKPQWIAKAVAGSDGGWTAELVIPFDSLEKNIAAAPQHGAVWKMNIVRNAGKPNAQFVVPTQNKNGIGASSEWQQVQFIGEKIKP